ncbi:hypothetical protein MPTK1_6g03180 [Marchantia polymorpha subsp. ruderalis]|uniref:Uncharacterized protein n=2 Tax=Marchantia polymorpha TaxID=3197 RepID=A0AAF6BN17_MARPO|nr:hypothetical protein MARPO_0035s0098 [Marchantia polymorpha]BBN13401.1 hypothetical protein Mp_6g03180 [Marchantia polymorpha subsp. ruderalis]|eukprot:PTQ41323.1 hypothetical protein MARPO_0035s0098 [Marchantia polymorpha]
MQVARIIARPRCFSSVYVPSYRNGVSKLFRAELRSQDSKNNVVQATCLQPYFSRLFPSITSRESRLKLLKPVQSTVNIGRSFGRSWICGLAIGSTYLSRYSGLGEVSYMEKDEQVKKYSSEISANWEKRQYRLVLWIRRLWLPSLCVLTIALGWQYPLSLVANILFLMWSSKPSPSSIYMWVEERREEEAMEKRGLERVKAQVSGFLEASAVMHVEVRDYKLFCLARVTSLTKRSTMIGILGDWWVIYSSTHAIHTGVNMRNLMATVPPFVKEQFSMN